ncbi:MAG: histidine phosphatase family protein [Anaerolineales bacterium]|nr:histidine phosphatase family protein [Anaerolineales bacterium]
MTTFLLIRHGQTDWNLEGRYTGQSDIPLNETGREQAQRAAAQLQQSPPDVIYSSDLKRARETAEIIGRAFRLPVATDPRLREIDQGEWEGMLFPDIKERFEQEFNRMRDDPFNVGPPGGESVGQVWERVLASADEIAQSHPRQRVVLVSHGLALAIIKAHGNGHAVDEIWGLIPPNATVEVVAWNARPHDGKIL